MVLDPGPSGLTLANSINGTGTLTKIGNGSAVLTGTSGYSGGTTVSGGTLQLGDGLTANGVIAGNVANNAVLVFANPSAQTFSGTISGAGSVIKSGSGLLTIAVADTYSGGTTLTEVRCSWATA